jgi:hypothetical protein
VNTTLPKKSYSETSLGAGARLLRAVKEKLLKEKGEIDYASLKRDGYSEDLISRLKEV